jgi:hypothetical protein
MYLNNKLAMDISTCLAVVCFSYSLGVVVGAFNEQVFMQKGAFRAVRLVQMFGFVEMLF